MAANDGVPADLEVKEEEYRPRVFLQNLELKNSAPESKQQVLPGASALVILPLDTAKS